MTRLRIATLNLRNLADRWEERLPLLLADAAALRPDLLGLQEVVYPMQQDRLLAAATPDEHAIHRGWAGRPEYGNSLLVRQPLAATGPAERLDLGHARSAHRVTVALPDGATVVVAVTHLHHLVPDTALRDEEAAAVLAWLDAGPPAAAQVLMGDFNADPTEPAYLRVRGAGFRSAFLEVNGAEPAVTWPSGLRGPAIDTDGDPSCLDYVFVRGSVLVLDARLWADRPAAHDPGLYPSDHFGIVATVEIA